MIYQTIIVLALSASGLTYIFTNSQDRQLEQKWEERQAHWRDVVYYANDQARYADLRRDEAVAAETKAQRDNLQLIKKLEKLEQSCQK